jgi:hypothetical protein
VYNLTGAEIAELAGKEYSTGLYTVEFDTGTLGNGIYIYTLKTGNFSVSRKMIIQEK